jgi:hypothetical protein
MAFRGCRNVQRESSVTQLSTLLLEIVRRIETLYHALRDLEYFLGLGTRTTVPLRTTTRSLSPASRREQFLPPRGMTI